MPTYPSAERPRRAYDRDGSTVVVVDGSTPSAPTEADIAELNTTAASGGISVGTNEWLVVIFPTVITIESMFLANGGTSDETALIESSLDTTTGADGTWDAEGSIAVKRGDQVVSGATWRADLVTGLSIPCKAIRVDPVTTRWQTWHIHGGGPDEDPSGLVIRSGAYEGIPDGVVDWGRTPRGSSADRRIVVANAAAQTAIGVTLEVESAEADDSFAVQHYLSLDDRDFTSTLDLGEIAPNSRSDFVTVRRVTPVGASLGARAARLVAYAESWE